MIGTAEVVIPAHTVETLNPTELYLLCRLWLIADDDGLVVDSMRSISRRVGLNYHTVRTNIEQLRKVGVVVQLNQQTPCRIVLGQESLQ